MRRTLLVAFLASAHAFVTISQSRFGAQIDVIRDLMHVRDNHTEAIPWSWPHSVPDQQLLGYLWNMPGDLTSHLGLGGGITWAWDPALCDALLPQFHEDFFFVHFVDCNLLKAAMNRGFHSWSANSARLSFVDVTEECERIGQLNKDCPLAELWVTTLGSAGSATPGSSSGQSTGRRMTASAVLKVHEADVAIDEDAFALGGGQTAALAQPVARYSTEFRYTNGRRPESGRVIETYGGEISFNTDLCWYLDSTFCSKFHLLKSGSYSPDEVLWMGRGILIAIWTLAFLYTACQLCHIFRAERKHTHGLQSKCHAMIDRIHRKSMLFIAIRLILLVAPPTFYVQIFLPCWDCFDFEAAATHEVGHILGLGHPDTDMVKSLADCAGGCGTHPGQNVYNSALYGGGDVEAGRLSPTSCQNPWTWVEPWDPYNQGAAVRPSIMLALTQHNPSVCLEADDLEALNTLYPDCSHSISRPICDKVEHNIGWIRLSVWVGFPVLTCMACLLCLFSWASHHQNARLDAQIKARMQRSVELIHVKGKHKQAVDKHAAVEREFEEHKATEGERIQREARRLSCQYIKQFHAEQGASPPRNPPAGMPPAGRPHVPRVPLHQQPAAHSKSGFLSHMLHHMFSPRVSRPDRHSTRPSGRYSDEVEEESGGAQGDSPITPARDGAIDRARGIVKRASQEISHKKLKKQESAGLLGAIDMESVDASDTLPEVLEEGGPSAYVEGADGAGPSDVEQRRSVSSDLAI